MIISEERDLHYEVFLLDQVDKSQNHSLCLRKMVKRSIRDWSEFMTTQVGGGT